ncbi:MAG: hypothetical protein RLZZ352_2668 [Pseudomonadota bacterium]|jgi:membrane protein involved in colicin uptake
MSSRIALFLLSLLTCTSAAAQWQWVDDTGRKVFSDTPPPLSVPDKNILKWPPGQASKQAPAADTPVANAAPAAKPVTAPPPTGTDSQLEARKKEAEAAELAKKKADDAKRAQVRSENCERARRAKATLSSGMRMATVNAQGEREIMDDKARAAEEKRLDGIMRSDCGKVPASAGTP